MAPVAVLAGTSVGRRLADAIYTLWNGKVFALPGRGLGQIEGTYRQLEERLVRWVDRQGEPIVLAGHSQGALHAVRFAVDHPDLVARTVAVGGPFKGSGLAVLKTGCVAGMASDSLWLERLRVRTLGMQNLTLVAGSKDLLVEVGSAHGIWSPHAVKLTVDCGHIGLLIAPQVLALLAG